jgi:hypothetical protein
LSFPKAIKPLKDLGQPGKADHSMPKFGILLKQLNELLLKLLDISSKL